MSAFASAPANTPITSFTDVPTSHWAHADIIAMAQQGHILGFEGGTFRPNESVTHLQSLVLLARILGINDAANADALAVATQRFASVLAPFDSWGERYVAFLLYNDVIFTNELELYVSDEPLPRYQAAVLLTKLMGGEREVRDMPFVISSFRDGPAIPAGMQGFAEFVLENELMQGTGTDPQTGAPIFSPLTMVTRAQMATMLANILPVMNRAYVTGTVAAVDVTNNRISVTTPGGATRFTNVASNSVIYINGVTRNLSNIAVGNHVRVSYVRGTARVIAVSTQAPPNNQPDGEVEYVFTRIEPRQGVLEITVQDINNQNITRRYPIAPNAQMSLNGLGTTNPDIRAGDLVFLTFTNNAVSRIRAYSRMSTVTGTLNRIIGTDSMEIELANGNTRIIHFARNREIIATRNNRSSTLSSLAVGDTVNLTLDLNRITRVDATTVVTNQEGVIESVLTTREHSEITIRIGEESIVFHISPYVEITLDGNDSGEIRDLRPGSRLRFRAESQTITEIETTSIPAIDVVEGIVRGVDLGFRFINVEVRDPITNQTSMQEILVLDNALITQVTPPGTRRLSDIRVGQRVIAHGSNVTGNFRASHITIISE